MKKFVSMFSVVMAIASVSFVSCGNDDDVINTIDPQAKPQEQPTRTTEENNYRALKFWASDDLLAITDVTCSGLAADYSFTEGMTLTTLSDVVVNGKAGKLLEASKGNSAKITFTLKEDWKQRVAGKEQIKLYSAMKQLQQKGEDTKFTSSDIKGQCIVVDMVETEEDLENLNLLLETFCNFSITF